MTTSRPLITDQSHINKVRDALWNRPGMGASVMVGSGFSRNATKVRPDADEIPLWSDITQEVFKELYPDKVTVDQDGTRVVGIGTEGALSLAQEYDTGFGRSELYRLLEGLVRDSDFIPGDLHSRLLKLPWRDVFTTNWDTLLEQATSGIAERAYSVVQEMDQIPLMTQPRIVKLHGSFPSTYPLIVTEEDYRTYPTKFAPFVNTVQQAMMETMFLLIGFSGDDPNFLHWSGWVRDNLGSAAPKIYLAGCLGLSPHRRRMLEDRGVVPIDVSLHPKALTWPEHSRHQRATDWVLHTLERGQPYNKVNWPSPPLEILPSIPEYLTPVDVVIADNPKVLPEMDGGKFAQLDDNERLKQVRLALEAWAYNRRLYPGWMVFPSAGGRANLSRQTDDWEPRILAALPDFNAVERLHAVRELLWRREILLDSISDGLDVVAREALEEIDCENRTIHGSENTEESWSDIRACWRTVALGLLTNSRLQFNEPNFRQLLEVLAPFSGDLSDVAHKIYQERCLWAAYSLDLEALNGLLDDWHVDDSAPAWMLRKAALLTEAKRHSESGPLVQRVLNIVRRDFTGTQNIAAASLESWALASSLAINNGAEVYRRWEELSSKKCDAGNELETLKNRLRGASENREAPAFDLGTRRGSSVRYSVEGQRRLTAAYNVVRLLEMTGLPPINYATEDQRIPVTVVLDTLKTAANELVESRPELAMRLVLRICNYDRDVTLLRVLSRGRIASISEETVESLAQVCLSALNYDLARIGGTRERPFDIHSVERMRVAMEGLSRFVLRLQPDRVGAALDLGMACYKTPGVVGHRLLASPLGNLLNRAWQALPSERKVERAFDILSCPIPGMEGFPETTEMVDPGVVVDPGDLPVERTADNEQSYRGVINFLCRGLRTGYNPRKQATLRLLPLSSSNGLTDAEASEIALALWDGSDPIRDNTRGPGSPRDWVYLILPELVPGEAENSFRRKWLSVGDEAQSESVSSYTDILAEVAVAFSCLRESDRPFELTDGDKELIIATTVKAVEMVSSSSVGLNLGASASLNDLPLLLSEVGISGDVAESLFQKVRVLLENDVREGVPWFQPQHEIRVTIGFALLPALIEAMPEYLETMVSWLRTGLASDDDVRCSNAIGVLRFWVSLEKVSALALDPIIDELVQEIGIIVSSRRRIPLADALWCSKWVFDKGTRHQQDLVGRFILNGLSYLTEELQYERETDFEDVTTLRLLCVQLASAMAGKGYGSNPIIVGWLDIGRSDPFPEIRCAALISEC